MTRQHIRRYFRHGTLTQIHTFEAVARLGSFTRAADELCLAQPTVSVHMQKLSDMVGVPLLQQVGKRIQITAAGNALLNGCADILQTLSLVEDKIAPMRNSKREKPQAAVLENSLLHKA